MMGNMKRNDELKNTVDNLLFKIFQYIEAAHVSDNETSILALEMCATCLTASYSFPEGQPTKEDIREAKSYYRKVTNYILTDIYNNLDVYIKDARKITTEGD